VHVLETFQLELSLGLLHDDVLLSDSCIGVHLRISHADVDRTLALRLLLQFKQKIIGRHSNSRHFIVTNDSNRCNGQNNREVESFCTYHGHKLLILGELD